MDLFKGDTQRIIDACRRHGLTTPQTAYVLATANWETAHTMKPVEEAFWKNDAWRRGNLRYYPWHGRGYVQLTWEANYLRAGKALDVDLITRPEMALDASVAAEIIAIGMRDGWFTGKKLKDYIDGAKQDFVGARMIVNGRDRAGEIAQMAEGYMKDLIAVPVAPPAPPAVELPDAPTSAILGRIIEAIVAFLQSILKGLGK